MTDSSRSGSPPTNTILGDDLTSLRSQLVEQRRQTTFLKAELYEREEAFELMKVQLEQSKSESLASRNRRKEMARIIGVRDARIKELTEELQARYAELAVLQRQMMGSRVPRLFRKMFARD